jgi:tRNA(fMet)-specific endonuclease VapC
MSRLMLDTNMVGFLVRGRPAVVDRAVAVSQGTLCVSAITRGEVAFGVSRRPPSNALKRAIAELWDRLDILPWDAAVADCYGVIRANMERKGKPLGALDMMIAAHALAVGAVLVTNDGSFTAVDGLRLEDWTKID